jgi:DNA-binding transcriptional LysR family regulator
MGAIESLSPLISSIIERVSRRYPKIAYRVAFGDVPTLISGVRERALDFAILRASVAASEKDLSAEVLFRDRLIVVAAPEHPLARHRKIHLRDLVDEWWALGPTDSFLSQLIFKAFRSQGLPAPRVRVTTLSIQQRLDLAETGRFVTVYSGAVMAHGPSGKRLRMLPVALDDDAGPMAAITLKARQQSGALRLVLEETRGVAKAIRAAEKDR